MKLKIEFTLKETGEYVSHETTLENVKFHDFICFTNPLDDEDEYVYVVGTFKIWKPVRNIICGKEVEIGWLRIESNFE